MTQPFMTQPSTDSQTWEKSKKMIKGLKVACVHDYLVQYGGAEKTLEAILELFPQADIYTGIYEPKNMPEAITSHQVFAIKNPVAVKFAKVFTLIMPLLFEQFDLRKYDLILSDGTAWPKGVLTQPEQLHISYLHTPPRFLYGYSVESPKRNKWYFKPIVPWLDTALRVWDYLAAQRPDYIIANSNEVKNRIQKFYGRASVVIYPPVELDKAHHAKTIPAAHVLEKYGIKKPFFLALGRLSAIKNFDKVIMAFNILTKTLVLAGTGPEEPVLKAIAKANTIFTGRVSDQEKFVLLHECMGVINPMQDEDLGIVPIEAHACGKPVLAHNSGGHLETISDGVTGLFFDSFAPTDLAESIEKFDQLLATNVFNSDTLCTSAQKYSKDRFKTELLTFILERLHA